MRPLYVLSGWAQLPPAAAGAVVQQHHAKGRVPGVQLLDPLVQHGGWADHQGGSVETAVMQAAKKRDDLDRLAQAHFICDMCWATRCCLYLLLWVVCTTTTSSLHQKTGRVTHRQ